MAEPKDDSLSSSPLDIRRTRSPSRALSGSPRPSSHSARHASTGRFASPRPTPILGTPPVKQIPTPSQIAADKQGHLPDVEGQSSLPGPGQSVLAAALARDQSSTPPRGTPSRRAQSPATSGNGNGNGIHNGQQNTLPEYGSFDDRARGGSPAPNEDADVVRRHLVQQDDASGRSGHLPRSTHEAGHGMDEDEFSSLRLQGGDITRPIYRWTEEQKASQDPKYQRSKSFSLQRPEPDSEVLDISTIKVPGGFRRDFLRRNVDSPEPSSHPSAQDDGRGEYTPRASQSRAPPPLFTNNFLEFLTIYGHFAGEELEEDDEVLEPDEYFSSDAWEGHGYNDDDNDREPGEGSALLAPRTPGGRRRKHRERGASGNNTIMGAALLLLKSFVGTGVLFLPRAFLNGGMLFSVVVLVAVAVLAYVAFILLVDVRSKLGGSYGDLGAAVFGKWMRSLILVSIVISQVGFVSAYTVFTAQNLQAFIVAVSKFRTFIDIKWMILMQVVIFLPLSLIRDISKLGFTALVADVFILMGLIYLYYYDVATIVNQRGVSDIVAFNPATWTLFIGTATFTFEGIGLILPIQESMRKPAKFPGVLAVVMIISAVVFTSIGALSYAAYGSKTRTVVLLNLPQDDKFVNGVQFLYSLAILLSTPLQLFPAVRIMENEFFTRSGKYNPWIKWKKNVFRFFMVIFCSLVAWGGAADLDKFVALVGSFACVPLVWVYPPLLHAQVVARTRAQKAADYTLCCFGAVCCVYTTSLTLSQWIGQQPPKAPS